MTSLRALTKYHLLWQSISPEWFGGRHWSIVSGVFQTSLFAVAYILIGRSVSQEEDIAESHTIKPNGYDTGR